MEFIIIKTTFASKKDAAKVASLIIKSGLAACTQISEIDSFYKWEGKVQHSSEFKLEIKTLSKNYEKIEELIIKNHDYDIPEIISYELYKGSKKYLKWMKEVTK